MIKSSNNRYFITGIGTGIGKTLTSMILCKKLNLTYYKPIQTGSMFTSDEGFVKKFGVTTIPTRINFPAPEAPSLAALKAGSKLSFNDIFIPDDENILIEGAGGIMVPIYDNFLMLDLLEKSNTRAIIVTNCKLGSISQTLLTIFAIKSRNIPIVGLVFNGTFYENIANEITRLSNCKIIAKIPNLFSFSDNEIENIIIKIYES